MNQQRTYDDWSWWEGAGAQSAALKEFDDLSPEGQGALLDVMGRWLRGECTRKECELLEPDLYELKTRVGTTTSVSCSAYVGGCATA